MTSETRRKSENHPEKRELGKDRWYSQIRQVETDFSTWDRWDCDKGVSIMGGTGWDCDRGVFRLGGTGWDWDRSVFRLGGTGWDWDRGVFELTHSTCPTVGLQGRDIFV